MATHHGSPVASGVLLAVASALSFGVTTPLIARFGTQMGPFTIAALLYAGAATLAIASRGIAKPSGRPLTRAALPRLLAVAFFGAALAPTLLAWGLSRAGAIAGSLALNFEALMTVFLAWALYGEHVGRRVALAAFTLFVGGVLVALDQSRALGSVGLVGLLGVLGATASWALDNTLTRALAEEEPTDVVAAKGGLGALATASLAFIFREPEPNARQVLALFLCGATGYGLSLRLYLVAQRRIGAVRTGSVFAAGPFVGAALAWLLGDRQAGWPTGLATLAFALGAFLHLTERHSHGHVHASVEHEHAHRHDDGHHTHRHDPEVDGEHTHVHRHERTEHTHEHAPDIHHEHTHG